MKSKLLTPLRSHLNGLSWSRWLARSVCGLLMVALVLTWLLLAVFAADWSLHLGRTERGVLLGLLAVSAAWAYWRWLHGPLRQFESPLDLALKLERQCKVDSDLVAALQFDEGGGFGSTALEQAVIERAALTPLPALEREPAARRLPGLSLALGATLAATLALAVLSPAAVGAFARRLLLGAARYPTRTVITNVLVNGKPALKGRDGDSQLRIPVGRRLRFVVECRGELPLQGLALLESLGSGARVDLPLDLEQDATQGAETGSDAEPHRYVGEFPRLMEPIRYRIRLGDDETESATIEIVPFPVVTLEIAVTPPAYAGRQRAPVSADGLRRISVLEGSRVDLVVHCANKPLQSVGLVIADEMIRLEAVDDRRQRWELTDSHSPLFQVSEPLQFEILSVDDDGLATEEMLSGSIAFEADLPPRVAAGVVTELLLPEAEPAVSWGATDDYGLAAVRLVWEIAPATGEPRTGSMPLREGSESESLGTSVRGRRRFPLTPLALASGDEVRLTVEAIDDRGPRAGTVTRSETVTLRITDEAGILAALVEADEESLQELDEMIEQQLGLGAAP